MDDIKYSSSQRNDNYYGDVTTGYYYVDNGAY